MDEVEKRIKKYFNETTIPEEYYKVIENTLQMIKEGKISPNVADFKQKKKNRFLKISQAVAAVAVIGVLGLTTYAGVTRKIKF